MKKSALFEKRLAFIRNRGGKDTAGLGCLKPAIGCLLVVTAAIVLFTGCTNISVLDHSLQASIPVKNPEPATTVPMEVRMRGIWFLGGSDGANLVSEVDLYDPATGIWYPAITSLPTPRRFCSATVAGGKIFVIGGIGSDNLNTAANEVFDISNHSWSEGVPLPVPMQGMKVVSIGGAVYSIGGSLAENSTGAHSKILRLNNDSGAWIALYDIAGVNTTFRTDGAATVLDGILFFSGGRDDVGTYYNTHYGHYVADYTGVFTATALISQRFAHSAAVYSSLSYKYIFYTGGIYANGQTSQPCNSLPTNLFYYYKPPLDTQSMTAGPLMNIIRAYHGSVVWRTNLYVFGGYNNTVATNSFECLSGINRTNISVLSWANGTNSMPRCRYGFDAVTADQITGE